MTADRKLTCLIIDDEIHARKLLRTLIEENCPEVSILEEVDNVTAAQELIKSKQPDLIFLDIKLKNKTAFELLENLEETNFQIIFTTAYSEYAIRAFEYSTVHYLLKPINVEQLEIAIKRAIGKIDSERTREFVEIYQNFKSLDEEKIALPTRTGDEFVYIRNILCCIASGSYTELLFKDGRKKLISKPLGYFEKRLNPIAFCRTHKKYMVNILEVDSLEKGRTPVLVLSGGIRIDVSLTYKEEVLDKLGHQVRY